MNVVACVPTHLTPVLSKKKKKKCIKSILKKQIAKPGHMGDGFCFIIFGFFGDKVSLCSSGTHGPPASTSWVAGVQHTLPCPVSKRFEKDRSGDTVWFWPAHPHPYASHNPIFCPKRIVHLPEVLEATTLLRTFPKLNDIHFYNVLVI